MKIRAALTTLALLTLTPSIPAVAGPKDDKLPRCNGQKKRPANLYGTVLPTVPKDYGATPAGAASAAPAPAPTNLFPPPSDAPAGAGPVSSNTTKVPAISANLSGDRHAALPTSYASC